MIVTNVKKFSNFTICYGTLREGDVIYHENNDMVGIHQVFYGIRGDGYVFCPELDETVHPDPLSRHIEDIGRFENKPLEYHGLSKDNSEYLMFIRRKGSDIISVSDLWMNSDDQKIIDLNKDETIICFEGEAEIIHQNGSKNIKTLNGITSSKDQKITVKSINNAKLVRVKCERLNR